MNLPPDCVLDIPELDRDHLAMASAREAMRPLAPERRKFRWMSMLEAFREHFRLEDSLMEADYPRRAIHQEDHRELLAHLERVGQALLQGADIADHELDRLRNWMESHLRSADRELAEFLHDRELSDLREECQWEALDLPRPDRPAHHP